MNGINSITNRYLVNKNNLDVDIETDFTFLTQDEDEFEKLKELIDDNNIQGQIKESKINEEEEDFDKILSDGSKIFDFLINFGGDPKDLKGKAKRIYAATDIFYSSYENFCESISKQTNLKKEEIDELANELMEYWELYS